MKTSPLWLAAFAASALALPSQQAAAETGHLVFATLHTNDAAQTVDRVVDAFPADAHAQTRSQLAAELAGIVALRLVPRRTGAGRRASRARRRLARRRHAQIRRMGV